MRMKKTISITLDEGIIKYVDELASINGRSRSNTIEWVLKMEMARDAALDEEAENYDKAL